MKFRRIAQIHNNFRVNLSHFLCIGLSPDRKNKNISVLP